MGKKQLKSNLVNRGYATSSIPSSKNIHENEKITNEKEFMLNNESKLRNKKDSHFNKEDVVKENNNADSFYTSISSEWKKDTRLTNLASFLSILPNNASSSSSSSFVSLPILSHISLTYHQEMLLLDFFKWNNPPFVLNASFPNDTSFPFTCFTTGLPSSSSSSSSVCSSLTSFCFELNYMYHALLCLGFNKQVIPFLLQYSPQPWDLNETLHFACLILPTEQLPPSKHQHPVSWTDKLYHPFPSFTSSSSSCSLNSTTLVQEKEEEEVHTLDSLSESLTFTSNVESVEKEALESFDEIHFDDTLNIFDTPLPSSTSSSSPLSISNETENPSPAVEQRSFPLHSWTGKLPEQLLREWVFKEEKISQIKFQDLSLSPFSSSSSSVLSQYQFTCKINDQVYSPAYRCTTKLEARNYIATVALYHRAKGRPLYKSLPPSYQTIWFELEAERKHQLLDTQLQFEKEKIDLFHFIFLAHSSLTSSTSTSTSTSTSILRTTESSFPRIKPSTLLPLSKPPTSTTPSSTSSFHRVRRLPIPSSLQQARDNLPVSQYKSMFLELLSKHALIVVQGATGSGKSTQLPQFILEHALFSHEKMYCTQPRRLSALSLAERVNVEWGKHPSQVGQTIGYSVKLDSKVTKETNLVFCTTGILLRMLEQDPELKQVRYLIIDEVHERTIESDFLLVMIKKILSKPTHIKVILMSATLQGLSFSTYFPNCPILEIPGKTYPVTSYFLEDILTQIQYEPDLPYQRDRTSSSSSSKSTMKKMNAKHQGFDLDDKAMVKETFLDDASPYLTPSILDIWYTLDPTVIHYDLIVLLILRLIAPSSSSSLSSPASTTSILVFLPGLHEIKRLLTKLEPYSDQLWCLPLHSSLNAYQQHLVFQPAPQSKTKVIVSTNLAETGITIDDITVVIDSGKSKTTQYDSKLQFTRLTESFISKSNCLQRKGRAGRTRPGEYYALFSKYRFEKLMADQETPEILRMPLESTILRMKWHGFDDIQQTFTLFMDVPSSSNIRSAIEKLQISKALDTNDQLTPLGRFLVKLPLDVELGKLIAFGAFFHCFQEAVTVAAYLSSNVTLFDSPAAKTSFLTNPLSTFSSCSSPSIPSDLIVMVKAYEAWKRASDRYRFCQQTQSRWKAFQTMHETRRWLLQSIHTALGVSLDAYTSGGFLTLPLALVFACYPQVFCFSSTFTHASLSSSSSSSFSYSSSNLDTSSNVLVSLRGQIANIHSSSMVSTLAPKIPDPWYCAFSVLIQSNSRATLFEVTQLVPEWIVLLASLIPFHPNYLHHQCMLDSKGYPVRIPSKTLAHLREFHFHLISAFEKFILHPDQREDTATDALFQVLLQLCNSVSLKKPTS